ncbi:glycosyltransferase family 2 protein [Crocosphaera sp. Alani8]|uniref:glycosyltransferase family 2 protein n=1 Tax=Crocosphaera sp. Alani8 TaxID=3038952 RepID=UPI00313D201D
MNTKLKYPAISTITTPKSRPFWSVMITSYKRTQYLGEVIKSLLDQNIDEDEMQIEVVDDHSPNYQEIEKIVQEVGKGRVNFYHQPENVGIYANWNTCIQRASGNWIHILSDDDLVHSNFYQIYRNTIETYEPSVVIAKSLFINEKGKKIGVSPSLQESDGLLNNALRVLAAHNVIRTPGIVVCRTAYEKLGGFTSDFVFAPDWEMWTRLAASVKISYINQPLSSFRLHEASESSRLTFTGEFVTDTLEAAKLIHSRVTNPQDRKAIKAELNQVLSKASYVYSQKLVNKNLYKPSLTLAIWSLRLKPSSKGIKNLIKVLIKFLKGSIFKQ